MSGAGKRILLGHIAGAHGIRGDVIVRTYTGEPDAIADYGPLGDEAGTRTYSLKVIRVTPKGVIARVAGVADRTAAEKLKGVALYVARDKLPQAEAGAYYHADLIGLAAVAPDGQPIGKVMGVHNFGAGDLVEIQLAGSKSTELVPFQDACVPTIDIAAGRLTVIMPVAVGEPEPASGETEDHDDGDTETETPR